MHTQNCKTTKTYIHCHPFALPSEGTIQNAISFPNYTSIGFIEAHSLNKVVFDFHFKCHLRKTDKEKWEGEMIRRNTFIRKRMPNEKILYLLIWRSFSHYKNKIWNKNWDENRKLKRRELLHSLEAVANEIRNENRTELSLLNALQKLPNLFSN